MRIRRVALPLPCSAAQHAAQSTQVDLYSSLWRAMTSQHARPGALEPGSMGCFVMRQPGPLIARTATLQPLCLPGPADHPLRT